MMTGRTTRPEALLAVILVWLLVCAGLAWATHSALQLDRLQNLAEARRLLDEKKALALSRLDGLMMPMLGREGARPYEHFRAFYTPARALHPRDGSAPVAPVVVPSPLRTFRGPDWLLLHFQASETHGWSSPQVERPDEMLPVREDIPPPDPVRAAVAQTWLSVLEQRYTPLRLLSLLEMAQWNAARDSRSASRTLAFATANPDAAQVPVPAPDGQPLSRSELEFLRRGARLLQLQRENYPVEQCEPETVALENLDSAAQPPPPTGRTGSAACVQVTPTLMMPVWLDLGIGGKVHLALVRSVSVETSRFCTLQGVLIDWERLRELLEAEVRDLFPGATIVPVRRLAGSEPPPTHDVMQTIPARLEIPPALLVATAQTSSGLKGGLWIAWGATLLALAAVSYGMIKYVVLLQRRMEFVAAVTHELRTPLTSFQLYSDLLAQMPGDDGPRRQYAETLVAESRRLARLVENVLTYSRMGDAAPRLNAQSLSPADLLAAAADSAKPACQLHGKRLVVENHVPPGVRIHTDREFVIQILSNLIENACKYSAGIDDDRVWLVAAPAGAGVSFEVDDAGRGVAAADRRAVFKPFRRGTSGNGRNAGGVGLGLALSRYWAACLGGKLILRRSGRNPDCLTSFVLTLPATCPLPAT